MCECAQQHVGHVRPSSGPGPTSSLYNQQLTGVTGCDKEIKYVLVCVYVCERESEKKSEIKTKMDRLKNIKSVSVSYA